MTEHVFLTHLQHHFRNLPKQEILSSFRDKSWQRLSDLGLPVKSDEAFAYLSLKELYRSSFGFSDQRLMDKSCFDHAILPECKQSYLLFIDGQLSLDLSDISALPAQTMVMPLDEAMRLHTGFLQHQIFRTIKEENDPFVLANLALHSKGAFFYLPPKIQVKTPVQVLYLFTGAEPALILPRLHITVGSQSCLHWIATSCYVQPIPHLILPATEISLDEGASFDLINAMDCPQQAWHLESIRATVKKNARFHSSNFTLGARGYRQSYRIHLKGENSETDLNGLWMLKENRTAHAHVIVEHEAPFTRSMQRFKGVLNDAAQSSFEGKILVRPEAQKTEAYQLNKNLILSRGAVANSKPNLEIFADDVKASHGATVSQLDPKQLFYLKTRGIDTHQARRLLTCGFCREMIERIPYDSLLQKMLHQIEMITGAS